MAELECVEHSKLNVTEKDSVLSYLPLAHIAERLFYMLMFCKGGKIAIFES